MITKILYGVKEGENTFLPPAESARACSWVPKIARTVWIVDKVTNDTYNERVPLIQVMPLIAWSAKRAKFIMNVEIVPSSRNGLTKKSVANCLQTRPLGRRSRSVRVRGELEEELMARIDNALKIVFDLV